MSWRIPVFALLLCSSLTLAADWPQWLGPNRDGGSTEKVAVWKDAPKVLWRHPVGEGHSSPIVAGGRVILHTKVRNQDVEEVAAYDAKTGKPQWTTPYPRGKFQALFGNGPRGTPCVAAGRVYSHGITGMLSCLDAASGKLLWQVDTLKEFDAKNLFFGVSCSPLVVKDKVLLEVGGKGAGVVAFGAAKGDVVWKSQDDSASYASPIVLEMDGSQQAVFLTGKNVLGLNLPDGGLVWKFPFVDQLNESSTTPVRAGDLVIASSITYGCVALRLEKNEAKEVWKNPELTCYFSTPVPVGKDHVYVVTGAAPPAAQADLRCIEAATGKELWKKPKVGRYHASLLRTGDGKLLMLEDVGNLVLIDPSPKEYRELARAKVCGHTWAHPALSDGRVYLRDDNELMCVKLAE